VWDRSRYWDIEIGVAVVSKRSDFGVRRRSTWAPKHYELINRGCLRMSGGRDRQRREEKDGELPWPTHRCIVPFIWLRHT
jgi:hypothetical protein